MTKISKFYFDKARYFLEDDQGNELLLEVNYKNNTFAIKGDTVAKVRRSVEDFAKDILERKHGINFADKIKIY